MKKLPLFIAFAFAAIFARAQNNTLEVLGHNFSTVFEYNNVSYNAPLTKTYNIVEKPDGNILIANLYRRKLHPSSPTMVNIGDGFYTISRQEVAVADSTFLESNIEYDEDNGSTLLVHDPLGEGYIYVKFLYERVSHPEWGGFTWLEIFHSDEDLNFNCNPVMVPLEDVHIESSKGIMLDDEENLVVRYVMDGIPVFARIGIDGTVKDKQPMPGLFQGASWKINGMVAYSNTPREYAIYGWDTTPEGDTTFLFHVVDSLFNLTETVSIENNQSGQYIYFNNMISLLPYDDQTYFVVSQFTKNSEYQYKNGLRVAKYDKTSHEELGDTLISSYPIYTDLDQCAFLLDFEKTSDGSLYLGYRTCNNPLRGYITVLKLDIDLNTIWERRCHVMETGESFSFFRMKALENGVVLCARHATTSSYEGDYRFNTLLFLINDDGTNGTPENDTFLRPYMYYPNPAQDHLRLQYSPDVQPKQVELYDLQGRLVRSQSQGLESLNMQGLAQGQYLMKVTLEDGKSFTDKVVKE